MLGGRGIKSKIPERKAIIPSLGVIPASEGATNRNTKRNTKRLSKQT